MATAVWLLIRGGWPVCVGRVCAVHWVPFHQRSAWGLLGLSSGLGYQPGRML